MLQISATTRIFVCNQLVDFRKGIDGLAAFCRIKLNQDPYQVAIFCFAIVPDLPFVFWFMMGKGSGRVKRLSKGKFDWWPEKDTLDARQVHTLLWNGNPKLANFSDDWRKIDIH